MKKCPFCAEDIQEEAIKCKHCGSNLQGGNQQAPAPAPIKKRTSCLTWLALILIIVFGIPIYIVVKSIESIKTNSQTQNTPIQPQLTPEEQEKIRIAQEKADAEWKKTKAGQICASHENWTKEDCQNVANKKVWIGMSYDMLVEIGGKPDSANPSNYGSGTKWQWCYSGHSSPNCFYDDNGDKIIDAYN